MYCQVITVFKTQIIAQWVWYFCTFHASFSCWYMSLLFFLFDFNPLIFSLLFFSFIHLQILETGRYTPSYVQSSYCCQPSWVFFYEATGIWINGNYNFLLFMKFLKCSVQAIWKLSNLSYEIMNEIFVLVVDKNKNKEDSSYRITEFMNVCIYLTSRIFSVARG
jgi:hypothetical protein